MKQGYIKSNSGTLIQISTLLFIGIFLVIGPEWIQGPIHIHLFNNHGFETQDAIALIPLTIGSIWFTTKIWMDKKIIIQNIYAHPLEFLLVILILGFGIGTVFGLVLAAIF